MLSKRKLESYKRAEVVCRELRYQIGSNKLDMNRVAGLIIKWMDKTGNIKYERP